MHEYSIVQSLLDQCENIAYENDATKVEKIQIKIGIMSGVEPHLLSVSFDTFKEDTLCSDAELEIIHQPLVIECQDCKHTETLIDIKYACSNCGSSNIKVIDGEDMYLMKVEMS